MLQHEKSNLWATASIQENVSSSIIKPSNKKSRRKKKKDTHVYPAPNTKSFQEEDYTRPRRTRSTGHGRVMSIVIDPLESPKKDPTSSNIASSSSTTISEPVIKPRGRVTFEATQPKKDNKLILESPRASDFSFGEFQDEYLDENDEKNLQSMTRGKSSFYEHAPEYGQVGTTDATFGAHRGWVRSRDDEHGLQVADDEWAEILNDVNVGIEDDDLDINDKIEQYLEESSLYVKAGIDLPVSEINDLVRQFSTRNKGVTFQEEGMNGDVTTIYNNQQNVIMSGLGGDTLNQNREYNDEENEARDEYYHSDERNQPRRRRGRGRGRGRNNNRRQNNNQRSLPPRRGRSDRNRNSGNERGEDRGENGDNSIPGWSGPPPGTILVTQQQIIALKKNVNAAHQRRTKVLKKQLMANKKFIERLNKKLGDTTEKLIELQVKSRSHIGNSAAATGGGGGVDTLINGLNDDGTTIGNNKKKSADELRREKVKRSLLAGLVEAADQFRNEDINIFDKVDNNIQGCRHHCQNCSRWCNDHLPLTNDVRSIEARYGQNVASFFHFLRYVIFCFAFLSMFNLATYGWHIADIIYRGNIFNTSYNISKSRELTGECQWNKNLSHTVCELNYNVIKTPTWDNALEGWNWFNNIGNLRSVAALPSSFGFSQQDDPNSHSSFVFALNMLSTTGVLAILALIKLVREDRVFKLVHATDGGELNDFTKLTLDAWDHGLVDHLDAWDRKSSVTQQLHTTLHRATILAEINGRSRWTKIKIWSNRAKGVVLSILVQAVGWYLLYNLIDRQNGAFQVVFKSDFFRDYPTTANLAVPIAISTLNATIPTIIWMIVVKTEKWDDKKTEMKQITIRVFIAKVLNVIIAVISGALLWDPRLLKHTKYMGGRVTQDDLTKGDIGGSVDTGTECIGSVESGLRNQLTEKPLNECVMDTIASILLQLLLVNFVFGKITVLLKTSLKYLKYLSKGKKGKWKDEFWVPFYVVNLVYSVTLNVVCIPFYPLTFVIGTTLLFLEFKFTKFRLQNFMYKPLVPYSAKDIGLFFLRFYLIVVVFGIFWVHFFLSHESFCNFIEFRALPIDGNSGFNTTTESIIQTVNGVNKTENTRRTQSHNLYVRHVHEIEDNTNTSCIGLSDVWSPALHAEIISEHTIDGLNRPKPELCYDCEVWDPLSYEYQKKLTSNDNDVDEEDYIKLKECKCTRISTIWKAWSQTNFSKPLKLKLLDKSTKSWENHLKPACGPFVGYQVGYDALTNKMNDFGKQTFNTMIAKPSSLTIFSIVIVFALMTYLFRGNDMDAAQLTNDHEQLKLRTEVEGLRSRNYAIQQQLHLRRRQQQAMLKKD